ncbi:hypothetical protein ACWAUC_15205 [Bradyrhizobium guangdongense]
MRHTGLPSQLSSNFLHPTRLPLPQAVNNENGLVQAEPLSERPLRVHKLPSWCLPTVGKAVPTGADHLHEIQYDGYRLLVIRDHDRVRLITRGGNDLTKRFPWTVEAALKNRTKQFRDGVSDFNALHSRKHDHEVQLMPWSD